MKIFAIGDLHLASSVDKPMNVFGDNWDRHIEKIKYNWEKQITKEDLVIVAGDISWAMNLEEAKEDLELLHHLPGKKICVRGNHDYWWEKIGKLNQLYEDIYFLQNKAYHIDGIALCGTRGWLCPNDTKFTEHDQKIYEREAIRLKLALEEAKNIENKIVVLHYPPTNDKKEPSLFTELIETYNVKQVIYGHLHGERAYSQSLLGEYKGTRYQLVSADYLNFRPVPIVKGT